MPVFSFGDLGILVQSVDRGHLAWLTEFLTPQFEVRADAAHICRVSLVEDRAQYDAALTAGPEGGAREAFALDRGVVSLPRWRGAETRLFDFKRQLFYDLGGSPVSVTILSEPGNLQVRAALMNVVRELVTNHAQRTGGLLLHASAFAAGRRGVIMCGPKKAGKTTLLVHALRTGSVEYVSNDRVLVPPGASPHAHGVPTVVRLRRGTLDVFPTLAESLASTGYEQRLSLEESVGRPAAGVAPLSGARRLSPAQLCRVLGVQARAACEIAALVFPRITGEPGALSLRCLTPGQAALQLEAALFGIGPGRWTSDVFTLPDDPPPPDRGELDSRCRGLADHVPGFECRLGLNAYDGARATDDLLTTLLA